MYRNKCEACVWVHTNIIKLNARFVLIIRNQAPGLTRITVEDGMFVNMHQNHLFLKIQSFSLNARVFWVWD